MPVDIKTESKWGFEVTYLQWNTDFAQLATLVLISVYNPKGGVEAAHAAASLQLKYFW